MNKGRLFLYPFKKSIPVMLGYIFLPTAIIAVLVVYCLKNVAFLSGSHGLPELIAILVTAALHLKCLEAMLRYPG